MSDIVEHLRVFGDSLTDDAADEIERLRKENGAHNQELNAIAVRNSLDWYHGVSRKDFASPETHRTAKRMDKINRAAFDGESSIVTFLMSRG